MMLQPNKSALIRQLLEDSSLTRYDIAAIADCLPQYVSVVRARAGGERPCDIAWREANRDRRDKINRRAARKYYWRGRK